MIWQNVTPTVFCRLATHPNEEKQRDYMYIILFVFIWSLLCVSLFFFIFFLRGWRSRGERRGGGTLPPSSYLRLPFTLTLPAYLLPSPLPPSPTSLLDGAKNSLVISSFIYFSASFSFCSSYYSFFFSSIWLLFFLILLVIFLHSFDSLSLNTIIVIIISSSSSTILIIIINIMDITSEYFVS